MATNDIFVAMDSEVNVVEARQIGRILATTFGFSSTDQVIMAFMPVDSEISIVEARHTGRILASKSGFSSTDQTIIATAISELARNILIYAGSGEILIGLAENAERHGVAIVGRCGGPGIWNISLGTQMGYAEPEKLWFGLPQTVRFQDEFELDISYDFETGTMVKITKWVRQTGHGNDKYIT